MCFIFLINFVYLTKTCTALETVFKLPRLGNIFKKNVFQKSSFSKQLVFFCLLYFSTRFSFNKKKPLYYLFFGDHFLFLLFNIFFFHFASHDGQFERCYRYWLGLVTPVTQSIAINIFRIVLKIPVSKIFTFQYYLVLVGFKKNRFDLYSFLFFFSKSLLTFKYDQTKIFRIRWKF